MIVLALLLSASASLSSPASPPKVQIMAGRSFQRYARITDALCPARHRRLSSPAELADAEERFQRHVKTSTRDRIVHADRGFRGCANQDGGLSCTAQHTLGA